MFNVKNYRRKPSMLNRYISDLPSTNHNNQRSDRETQKQKNGGVPDLRIQDFVSPQKNKGRKVDQETPQPPRRQFRVRLFYNKADRERKTDIVVREPQERKSCRDERINNYEKPPKPAEEIVPEVTPILDGIIDDIIGNMHRSKKFYFSKTLKTTVKNRPHAHQEKNTTTEKVIQHRWSSGATHPSKSSSAPRKREENRTARNSSSSNSSNNSDLLIEHVSVEIGATYGSSTVKSTSEVHFPNRKGQKKKRRDKKRSNGHSDDSTGVNRDGEKNKVFEKKINLKVVDGQIKPLRDDVQEPKDEYSEKNTKVLTSQEKKQKQKKTPVDTEQYKVSSTTQQRKVASTEAPFEEEKEYNQSPMPANRKMIGENLPQPIRDIIGQELLAAMREKIGSDQLSSDTRELIGQQLLSALREPIKEQEPVLETKEEIHYPNLESIDYNVPETFQEQKGPVYDSASMPSATRQPIGHHLPQKARESVGQELLDALRRFIAQHQLPPDARETVGQEILQAMREPIESKIPLKVVRKPIGHMLPQPLRKYIGTHLFNSMMELVCVQVLSEEVRENIGRQFQAEMSKPVDKTKELLRARSIIGKSLSREQRELVSSELYELMKWYICEKELPLHVREIVATEIVEAMQEPEARKVDQVTRKPIGCDIPQSLRESLGQQLLQALRTTVGKEILSQASRELIGIQLLDELRRPVPQQPMTGLASQVHRSAEEDAVDRLTPERTLKEVIDQRVTQQQMRDGGMDQRRTEEADGQQAVAIPEVSTLDQHRFTQRVEGKHFNIDIDIDVPNRFVKEFESQRKPHLPQTSVEDEFAHLTPKAQMARSRETVSHRIPEQRVDDSYDWRVFPRSLDQHDDIQIGVSEYHLTVQEADAGKKPQIQKRKVVDRFKMKETSEVTPIPQVPQRPKRAIDNLVPQRPVRISDGITPQSSVIPNVNIDINVDVSPRLAGKVYSQVITEGFTSPSSTEPVAPASPFSAQSIQQIPQEVSAGVPSVLQISTQIPVSASSILHPTPEIATSHIPQPSYTPIHSLPFQPPIQTYVSAPPVPPPTHIAVDKPSFQPPPQTYVSASPIPSTHRAADTPSIQPPPQTYIRAPPVPPPTHIAVDKLSFQPPPQTYVSASPIASTHRTVDTPSIQPPTQTYVRAPPVPPPTHITVDKLSFQPPPQTYVSASPIPSTHRAADTPSIQPTPQIYVSLPPTQRAVDTTSFQPLTQTRVSAPPVPSPIHIVVDKPSFQPPTQTHDSAPTMSPSHIAVDKPSFQPPTQMHISAPSVKHPTEIPVCVAPIPQPTQAPVSAPIILRPTQLAASTPRIPPSTQVHSKTPTASHSSQMRRSSTSSSSTDMSSVRRSSFEQRYDMAVRGSAISTASSGLPDSVHSTALPPQIPSRAASSSFHRILAKESSGEEMPLQSDTSKQSHYDYSPAQSVQDKYDVDIAQTKANEAQHDERLIHRLSMERLHEEERNAKADDAHDPIANATTSSSIGGFQTLTCPIKELSSKRLSDAKKMVPIPKIRESVRQIEDSITKMVDMDGETVPKRQAYSSDSADESSIFQEKSVTLPVPINRISQEQPKLPIPRIRESFRSIRASLCQMMEKCDTRDTDHEQFSDIEKDTNRKFSEGVDYKKPSRANSSSGKKTRYSVPLIREDLLDIPQPPEFEPPRLSTRHESSLIRVPGSTDQLMNALKCPKVRESFKEMRESIHSMLDEMTPIQDSRRSRQLSAKTVSSAHLHEIQEENSRQEDGHGIEANRPSEFLLQKRKSFSIVTPSSMVTSSSSSSSSEYDSSFRAKVARMRTNSPPSSDDLGTDMGETVSDWNPRSRTVNDGFYVYRPLFRAPVHCILGKEVDNEEYIEEFITASDGAGASVSYIRDRTWLPYHRTAEMRFVIEEPTASPRDRRMTMNQRASVYGLDINALKNLQKTKHKLPIRTESALESSFTNHYAVPTINTIQKMRPIHDVQIEILAGTRNVKTETKAVEERLVTYFLNKVGTYK